MNQTATNYEVTRSIFVTDSFEALHFWKDAPESHKFLSYPHRHLFHVRVDLQVDHSDRQLEFFAVKEHVRDYCRMMEIHMKMPTTMSCEEMAGLLLSTLLDDLFLPVTSVTISEDGENGATVSLKKV